MAKELSEMVRERIDDLFTLQNKRADMSDLRISSHLYHGLGNDTLGIFFFCTE
jgi:hypothetical protein